MVRRKWIALLRWSEKYTQTDMVYVMHGGLLLLLGKAGLLSILALVMFFFANWLPPATYGAYEYILTIMVLFGIFSLPGLNTALVRSIAKKKEGSLALILKTKLKWSLLGSLGMFAIAAWYIYKEQSLLGIAIGIGGAFLPFYTVFPMFEAYWNGKKRFDVKIKYEIAVAFLAALCIIPTLYFTDNIAVILFVFFSSYTVLNGFFLWRTLQQVQNREEDAEGIHLGKSLTGIIAIWTLAEYADKIILWKFLGPAQLAIYAFAAQPLQRIIAFNPMGALVLPKVSESNTKQTYANLKKKFFKSFAVTLPIATGLALLAPFPYRIFFPQYMDSVIYFQALSVLIAMAPFVLINTALVVEMRKKELYIVNVAKAVIKIGLYLPLVPLLGIWGIVTGRIVGNVVANILLFYFFTKIGREHEIQKNLHASEEQGG
ncbi:MAG: oligosaccharide flippase family protein [bacterium]|nr:oligosaccharide flippase family protein [bacterium]